MSDVKQQWVREVVESEAKLRAENADLKARRRVERKFIRFVYEQLGTGPRSNGISMLFCAEIGAMAEAALNFKPKRKARGEGR